MKEPPVIAEVLTGIIMGPSVFGKKINIIFLMTN
jgi:hypothetical protein